MSSSARCSAILLLRANAVVSADQLIDQLWGAAPPATAAKAVQVYISRLRKTLPDDRVATHSSGSGRGPRERGGAAGMLALFSIAAGSALLVTRHWRRLSA